MKKNEANSGLANTMEQSRGARSRPPTHGRLRPHLRVYRPLTFGDFAEVRVIFLLQGFQEVRFEESLKDLFARELVDGQVLELVFRHGGFETPGADHALVLEHVRDVFLVVPLVECLLEIRSNGGLYREQRRCHELPPRRSARPARCPSLFSSGSKSSLDPAAPRIPMFRVQSRFARTLLYCV